MKANSMLMFQLPSSECITWKLFKEYRRKLCINELSLALFVVVVVSCRTALSTACLFKIMHVHYVITCTIMIEGETQRIV